MATQAKHKNCLPIEIKSMEQIANALERLINGKTLDLENSWFVHCQNGKRRKLFDIPLRSVFRWLQYNKPGIAPKVEEKYKILTKLAVEVRNKPKDIPELPIELRKIKLFSHLLPKEQISLSNPDFLFGHLRDFIETLRHIAKMAKAENSDKATQEISQEKNSGNNTKKKPKGRPPVDVQLILDFIDNKANQPELSKNKRRIWAFLAKKFNYRPKGKAPNRALQSLFTQTYPKYYQSIQRLK